MKKKFWKRAAALFVSTALLSVALPLSASAATYYDYLATNIDLWETKGPGCSITVYRDAEQTTQILDHEECSPGETYYYKIVCPEGLYVTDVKGDFEYLDTQTMVYRENFLIIPSVVYAGDINCDETLDLKDASEMIRYCAGFEVDSGSMGIGYSQKEAGDFNRDGNIDLKDVAQILRVLAGLEKNPYGGLQTEFDVEVFRRQHSDAPDAPAPA